MRRRTLLGALLLAGCARTTPPGPPVSTSTTLPAPDAPTSLASPDDGLPAGQAWVDAGHGLRFALASDVVAAEPPAVAAGDLLAKRTAAAAATLRVPTAAFRRRFVKPMVRLFVGPAKDGFPLLVAVESRRRKALPSTDELTDAIIDLNPRDLRTGTSTTALGKARALGFTLRKKHTVHGRRMAFTIGPSRVVLVWVLGAEPKAVSRTADLILHSLAAV